MMFQTHLCLKVKHAIAEKQQIWQILAAASLYETHIQY